MIEYRQGCDEIAWSQLGELYQQVGLVAGYGKKGDLKAIERSFRASSKVVTAWNDSKLVGAARAMSDEVCYSSVFDVGVLPEFQRSGIGKGLMKALLSGLEHTRIHLTSTFGNEEFYRRLGFKHHKTAMARYPFESEYLDGKTSDA